MAKKPVTNTGCNVMFVNGQMVMPGCSELVEVLDEADGGTAWPVLDEVVTEPGEPLEVLLERKVAEVMMELPGLTDLALLELEALEKAGKARKGLLAEVMAERLRRAALSGGGPVEAEETVAGAGETGGGKADTDAGKDETDGPVNRDADPVPEAGAV